MSSRIWHLLFFSTLYLSSLPLCSKYVELHAAAQVYHILSHNCAFLITSSFFFSLANSCLSFKPQFRSPKHSLEKHVLTVSYPQSILVHLLYALKSTPCSVLTIPHISNIVVIIPRQIFHSSPFPLDWQLLEDKLYF